jgi:hypothetical protein
MKEMLKTKTAFVWLVAGTCLLLLIPFFAMQFSREVYWTIFDFMAMGALLLLVGCLLIFLARKFSSKKFLFLAIVVLLVFLYVWAELAVGIFFSFGS